MFRLINEVVWKKVSNVKTWVLSGEIGKKNPKGSPDGNPGLCVSLSLLHSLLHAWLTCREVLLSFGPPGVLLALLRCLVTFFFLSLLFETQRSWQELGCAEGIGDKSRSS